ncbi:MAG TPA: hemin-degrading factor, partial [Chryseobacterium sp.]|nr:hemin-degrading factor [Chryseobacterium sp.]
FGVSRTQALRLAPEGFAKKIESSKVVNVLEDASEKELPIMIFVGNRGIIQIHTGNVKKTLWHQQWFNVMDPDFNLHLDVTKIAEAWIVKKPTEDGEVTAIEVFNKEGDFIVQFFGKRKPGIPELQEWKDLVADLEK